jgi:hypothetical protein
MRNLIKGFLIILCTLFFLSCDRNTQNNQTSDQNLSEDISTHASPDLAAYGNEARDWNEDILEFTLPALEAIWTTWQEAYAALLWDYASQCHYAVNYPWLDYRSYGYNFALHDINNNGIPELFLIIRHSSGHVSHPAVYAFFDDKLTPLDFRSIAAEGTFFAPLDDRAFIVEMNAVGHLGLYRRLELDGLTLIETASGYTEPSDAAREIQLRMVYEEIEIHDRNSYVWFNFYITTDGWDNRQLVTAQEFESIFPRRDERKRLAIFPITNENIEQFIFGRY